MGQMFFPEDKPSKKTNKIGYIITVFLTAICIAIVIIYNCTGNYNQEYVVEDFIEEPQVEEVAEDATLSEEEEIVEKESSSFNFETYYYNRSSDDANIELIADFPTSESALSNSVRQYIHEVFGDQHRCNYDGPQAILNYYGDKEFSYWAKEHQEDNYEGEDVESLAIPAYESETYFKVDCIEDKYVTFNVESHCWTGGAQYLGYIEYGVTFSKVNGEKIDYSCFKNLESGSFKRIIKEGIKRYFQNNGYAVSSDKQLAKCLLLDEKKLNDIPLPSSDPYFTPEGVCFKYGLYEIAAYSAGFPSFILPYDEARQYMTEDALFLIEDEYEIIVE